MLLANVAVPVPLGRAFSYHVPPQLKERTVPGARVLVDFGRRAILGVVLDVEEREPELDPKKIKPIRGIVDTEPVLPPDLLAFLVEVARYYLAPVGEVMRLALPAVERSSAQRLLEEGALGDAKVATVGRLVLFAKAVGSPPPDAEKGLRGQAAAILERLRASGEQSVVALQEDFGNARAATKRLAELGLVQLEHREQIAESYFRQPLSPDKPPEPTSPQAQAITAICSALTEKNGGTFLLHGVTGSGKTEVYLRCVKEALNAGGSAIVLVPEIALTPQLVSRFRNRLGDEIAVLHSGLTNKERHRMWRHLREGKLRIAIGARSALFAPVRNLAIVCIDEEHDTSFKQEEGVRYNARDMAMLRAHRARAVCVLGSATPSLATEALVRRGALQRLSLPDRAHHAAVLPEVQIVDLRRHGPGPSGHRLLTVPMHRALQETLEKKEQSILFLNRRGFAPSVVCESCGTIAQCPNCSVALTLHRARQPRLQCHHCDYSSALPDACPHCKSRNLAEEGSGTERVETALRAAFPGASVARLDRDVAAGLKSEEVLQRMRSGEIDILVGTQMVTKGHDLPNVTLVGVLNADSSLSLPDYQASERTFHLLVQVAGRAGRGDSPGKVLIQTRNPEHPAILLAVRHDVDGFVERELKDRQELGYPPFARLAMVRIDAAVEALAAAGAEHLATVARKEASADAEVLGPSPAPIPKIRNRYRYRFLLRSTSRAGLRRALVAVARTAVDRRVRLSWDVDPVNML